MILYARGPSSRKEEFSLATKIVKDDKTNSIHVEKIPLNDFAKNHLATIVNNYTALAKTNSAFSLPKPTLHSEDLLTMPFVSGDNLENKLFQNLKKRQEDQVEKILNSVLNIIKSNTKTTNPSKSKEYIQHFGNAYNSKVECTPLSLIDLNLDNLIISKNEDYEYTLVDYEWYFPNMFIPIHYLFGRLLYYTFAVRFKDLMRYYASDTTPAVEVMPGYIVPKNVYERYNRYFKGLDAILETEAVFLFFVTGKLDSKKVAATEPKMLTSPLPTYVEKLYLEKIGAEKQNQELRERFIIADEKLKKLRRDFIFIKKGPLLTNPLTRFAYRVARKIKHSVR